jgi:Protein of unknown function (DUF3987)
MKRTPLDLDRVTGPTSGPSGSENRAGVVEAVVAPYDFVSAFPPDHFVSAFITYAADCTDAAHEYFEAAALHLLATVTPNVRAQLRQYPNGLPTAFYVIFIGLSTRSRKSTVRSLARDLLRRVIPDALLAEQASPEAFVEQLAARSRDSAAWVVDEIGEIIDRLHHQSYLSGLRALLLELHDGGDYTFKRTTKKTKTGAPLADALRIEQAHLAILGCTTPSLFEILTSRDLSSGFLARFAVVMPAHKPPRRPFYEAGEANGRARNALVARLHAIYDWARAADRPVAWSPDALATLDHFCEQLEHAEGSDRSAAMLQRLGAMALKVAMLSAAGRPAAPDQPGLTVTPADAVIAVTVATRWQHDALALADRVGENEQERTLDRCLSYARRAGGRVRRTDVARFVHVSKDLLDKVQATLEDRSLITLSREDVASGPSFLVWTVVG